MFTTGVIVRKGSLLALIVKGSMWWRINVRFQSTALLSVAPNIKSRFQLLNWIIARAIKTERWSYDIEGRQLWIEKWLSWLYTETEKTWITSLRIDYKLSVSLRTLIIIKNRKLELNRWEIITTNIKSAIEIWDWF